MPQITLHAAPGTCAKVPMIVLEEIAVPFEICLVRFAAKEQKSPEYKKINPKGKVPAIDIDGQILTENPVILNYLNEIFPGRNILPKAISREENAQQLADLCFCSATLHPIVSRIRVPHFIAGKDASAEVWEHGCKAMDEYAEMINSRLSIGQWWYGEQWSAMDAYLYWIFWRVAGANYAIERFPAIALHASRMEQRPAVQRALEREKAMEKQLEDEGLLFTPPTVAGKK